MKTLILTLNLFSLVVFADELIMSKEQALSQGYRPAATHFETGIESTPPKNLNWPVKFLNDQDPIGNTMAQFQPFSAPPYFHGGCDLIVDDAQSVYAPTGGKIEAGHYSYVTNPDGSLTKFFKPWPESGSATYFEVAIISEGLRYEFHHVDRPSLPDAIVKLLNKGGGEVQTGALLGKAVNFPKFDYQHIHYNVIKENGIRINPYSVSIPMSDSVAPEIISAFAKDVRGQFVKVDDKINFLPTEIIVVAKDRTSPTSGYEHPPEKTQLVQNGDILYQIDFSNTLTNQEGAFPNLQSVYLGQLSYMGRTYKTEGGYGVGQSLIRLSTKGVSPGPIEIYVFDQAGNKTTLKFTVEI